MRLVASWQWETRIGVNKTIKHPNVKERMLPIPLPKIPSNNIMYLPCWQWYAGEAHDLMVEQQAQPQHHNTPIRSEISNFIVADR